MGAEIVALTTYACAHPYGYLYTRTERRFPDPEDDDYLETFSQYHPDGRVEYVTYPDDRRDGYAYDDDGVFTLTCGVPALAASGGTDRIAVIYHGTASQQAGIANVSNVTVRVTDQTGRLLFEEQGVSNGGTYSWLSTHTLRWTAYEYDDKSRLQTEYHSDGTKVEHTWGCCAEAGVTDRTGIERTTDRDVLGRVLSETKAGAASHGDYPAQDAVTTTITRGFDGSDNPTETTVVSDGTLSRSTTRTFDLAGRILAERDDDTGLETTYLHETVSGGRKVTRTLPGGATEITEYFRDGRVKSVNGTAVVAQFYEYGVEAQGDSRWPYTKVYTGADDSPRWTKTVYDGLGRVIREDRPAYDTGTVSTIHTYLLNGVAGAGQIECITPPHQANTCYRYDALSRLDAVWLDLDEDGSPDFSGTDRITVTEQEYELDGENNWWAVTRTIIYPTNSSDTGVTIAEERRQASGLTVEANAVTQRIPARGDPTITTAALDPADKLVTETTLVPGSAIPAETVTHNGLVQSTTSPTGVTTIFAYDGLGRRTVVTDPRSGPTFTTYNDFGVESVYTTDDGEPNGGVVTETGYGYSETTGRLPETIVHAAGTRVLTYDAETRELEDEDLPDGFYGADRDIERGYHADVIGRLTTLSIGGEYETAYDYDDEVSSNATGRLNRVRGPGLPGPTGGSDNGVQYLYHEDSDLVQYARSRTGAGTVQLQTRREYEAGRNLLSYVETRWAPAGANTLVSKYAYVNDARSRRTSVVTTGSAFSADRLTLWGYNERNELVSSYRHAGTEPADPGAEVAAERRLYEYDPIGNRTEATEGDDPALLHTYIANALNQYPRVDIGGGAAPIAQGYSFDGDGNLAHQWLVGDANCDGLLNSLDIDSFVATVGDPNSVEPPEGYEGDAECWGERYGWADINGDTYINNFDVDPFVDLLVGGQAALARTLAWDAENRLIDVRPATAEAYLPTNGSAIRVAFGYDYLGRRIEKIVYTWQSGDPDPEWVEESRTRFVYDGWLLLEELDVDSEGDVEGVRRQYTWGLDLAGLTGSTNDRTSAGGIGGLLAMYDTMGTTTGETPTADDESYYYCYDANGNVVQVLDASDGSIAVKYEYDAYGNRVNTPAGGELDQPFRFSTKYFDVHTAMYYYGYRYYLPGIGRWGSHDPLDLHDPSSLASPTQRPNVRAKIDALGPNLLRYGAFRNSPIEFKDPLGLEDCQRCGVDVTQQVDKLLLDLSLQFNRLPWGVAHDLCNYGMWDPGRGWDIHHFYKLGQCGNAYVQIFSDRCCGTSSCIGTVTYRGKCVWAVHLNYLLWGKMHRLCNARFQNDYMFEWQFGGMDSNGEWAVWVHRNTTAHAGRGPRCGPPDSAGRVAATRAGFSGDPDQLLTHPSCAPCAAKLNGPLYGQVGGNTIVHDPTGGGEPTPRRDSGRRPRW